MNKLIKIILIFLILYYLLNNKKSQKKKFKKPPSNLKHSMDIGFFPNLWNNTKKLFNNLPKKNLYPNIVPKTNILKKIIPQKNIIKSEIKGNMKINTYTIGLDKYKELTCINGKKLKPKKSFKHAQSKVNGCGSEKWSQFPRDVLNAFAAKGGSCCNNHDLCYYGYLNNGNPYIINNTFDSKNCEKNFKMCDPKGIMAPAVMLMSPSFLEESKFKCV